MLDLKRTVYLHGIFCLKLTKLASTHLKMNIKIKIYNKDN